MLILTKKCCLPINHAHNYAKLVSSICLHGSNPRNFFSPIIEILLIYCRGWITKHFTKQDRV